MSARLTPAARTRTSNSPASGVGSGTSTSSRTSASPGWRAMMAFMFESPPVTMLAVRYIHVSPRSESSPVSVVLHAGRRRGNGPAAIVAIAAPWKTEPVRRESRRRGDIFQQHAKIAQHQSQHAGAGKHLVARAGMHGNQRFAGTDVPPFLPRRIEYPGEFFFCQAVKGVVMVENDDRSTAPARRLEEAQKRRGRRVLVRQVRRFPQCIDGNQAQ